MIGALYFMLPRCIIALVTASALVVSYRTRRTYVVVLIWLAIIVLAVLFGPGRLRMTDNGLGRVEAILGSVLIHGQQTAALEPITHPDAYAVYNFVIPRFLQASHEALLIRRETEAMRPRGCLPQGWDDKEWQPVLDDYDRQNAATHLVQPLMNLPVPYRMITQAELRADDENKDLEKCTDHWPPYIDYFAVSAVGFNADHTKAYVYVRSRSRELYFFLAKTDGAWNVAKLPFGCGPGSFSGRYRDCRD